jgi:chromosome segregation ATPase
MKELLEKNKKIADLERIIQKMEGKIQDSGEEIEDLKSALLHANDTRAIKEQLRAVKRELARVPVQVPSENYEEQMKQARQEVSDLKSQLSQVTSECGHAKGQIVTLQTTVSSLESLISSLKRDNAELKGQTTRSRIPILSSKQSTEQFKRRASEDEIVPLRFKAIPQVNLEVNAGDLPHRNEGKDGGKRLYHTDSEDEEVTFHPPKQIIIEPPVRDLPPRARRIDGLEVVNQRKFTGDYLSVDELNGKIEKLTMEKNELERRLGEALPKEKGVVLSRIQREREEMDARLELVICDLAKYRLDLHMRMQNEK